jgi:hypothetical protein
VTCQDPAQGESRYDAGACFLFGLLPQPLRNLPMLVYWLPIRVVGVAVWQFLTAALSAIPSAATSWYALLAYALAIAASVFSVWRVARNKTLLENIQKLPSKDRLIALRIEMGGVHLAKGISPEQWIRSRIHTYYLFAFLATCAVVATVGTVAILKSDSYAGLYRMIDNQHRELNNGISLTNADLHYIRELIEAGRAHNIEKAGVAFNQLSASARDAYERAYPLAKGDLTSPDELKSAGQPPSELPLSKPGRLNLLSQKNGGEVIFSSGGNWSKINDDELGYIYGFANTEAVFGFKGGHAATFDTFAVYLPGVDERHPKDIELFAGDQGVTGSFRSLGTITLLNGRLRDGWQEFPLPETTSRFFKVKLISNFGGNDIYLYELRLYGVLK